MGMPVLANKEEPSVIEQGDNDQSSGVLGDFPDGAMARGEFNFVHAQVEH